MSSQTIEQVVANAKGKMEYTNLGKSGLRVSKICLGCMSYGDKRAMDWVLEEDDALPLIKAAYDSGINFFDTADIYCNHASERILGKAIKKYNLPRDEIVVATKCLNPIARTFDESILPLSFEERERAHYTNGFGLSRKHIFDAVDAALQHLDLTYIDLFQIHRADDRTPFEETMRALHDVVMSGKVRYIGASSMFAWQFMEYQSIAEKNGWTKFISMQNYYAASYREEEREMMPCIKKHGVGSIPWSPLAGGFLARPHQQQRGITSRGEKSPEHTPDEIAINESIQRIVSKRQSSGEKDISMAQIALAWVHLNPSVDSPIVGISNPRSLDDAVKSLAIKLTEEEVKEIESGYKPKEIVGHGYGKH